MRKWTHYFSNYVYEAFKSFRFAVDKCMVLVSNQTRSILYVFGTFHCFQNKKISIKKRKHSDE